MPGMGNARALSYSFTALIYLFIIIYTKGVCTPKKVFEPRLTLSPLSIVSFGTLIVTAHNLSNCPILSNITLSAWRFIAVLVTLVFNNQLVRDAWGDEA